MFMGPRPRWMEWSLTGNLEMKVMQVEVRGGTVVPPGLWVTGRGRSHVRWEGCVD